jgi:hypothetical protein
MSELINNSQKRKDLLKHMILQLHKGQAPDAVRKQLVELLGQVPYGEVVEVEQQLISEGLPQEEVLKLCDVHTDALKGVIDTSEKKQVPAGHPVDTFIKENRALQAEIASLERVFSELKPELDRESFADAVKSHFNALSDVEKHYRRKENLLFPFLEKHEISGPPTVMWGKHDETRKLLKAAHDALIQANTLGLEEWKSLIDLVFRPAMQSVEEMIYKEEQILFPMCMDTLTDIEWYEIYKQSNEIGYCLVDPQETWQPEGVEESEIGLAEAGQIQLASGGFNLKQLKSILNTLPVDVTFVDANDTVRYFSQGKERIFDRNRAILGRKVQMCHPPSSVHVVEQIVDDFKSGRQDQAAFWIQLHGKFIHIEYFALRDDDGSYLGTLEVSQDLTAKRQLTGERRILNYDSPEDNHES